MNNKSIVNIYAGTTQPAENVNSYWVDLQTDPYGSSLKYWNGTEYTPLIDNTPPAPELNGNNYVMVYGTGTPTENAVELQAVYEVAKTMPRYLGVSGTLNDTTIYKGQTFYYQGPNIYVIATKTGMGVSASESIEITGVNAEAEAKSVRTTVIVAPGDYGNPTLSLVSGINIVSLTGKNDVLINGVGNYGLVKEVRFISTASSEVSISDEILLCEETNNTLTLPVADIVGAGKTYTIKNIHTTASNINIKTSYNLSAEANTLDGSDYTTSSSYALAKNNAIVVVSDGLLGWQILSKYTV